MGLLVITWWGCLCWWSIVEIVNHLYDELGLSHRCSRICGVHCIDRQERLYKDLSVINGPGVAWKWFGFITWFSAFASADEWVNTCTRVVSRIFLPFSETRLACLITIYLTLCSLSLPSFSACFDSILSSTFGWMIHTWTTDYHLFCAWNAFIALRIMDTQCGSFVSRHVGHIYRHVHL